MVALDITRRYREFAHPPHPRTVDRIAIPIRQIIIHHWVGWYGLPEGATENQEIMAIDAVARDHLARFGIGPGYNYVVMPSGRSYYVGDYRTERRHTSNLNPATGHTWNWDSVAISVPGNWSVAVPRAPMIEAIHELVDWIRNQPWSLEPRIMGHRDAWSTACPGDNLYRYLPLFREPLEEDDMTPDEVNFLIDAKLDPVIDKLDRLAEVMVDREAMRGMASDIDARRMQRRLKTIRDAEVAPE